GTLLLRGNAQPERRVGDRCTQRGPMSGGRPAENRAGAPGVGATRGQPAPVGGLGTRSIGRSTDGSSDKSLPATRPGGALEGSPGQGPGSVAGLIPGSGGAAGICRTDH